ncbi:MAG TPA: ribonuclease R [Verrucomicrobia bacterium]|nr:MAG: ribonuclease R [Lentisphaerae bacterium GWF2_57_35]HBA86170.1 ribonuclease R [Verrucomicrobiota bacterium]
MEEFTPSLEHRIYEFLGNEKYIPLKQHELAKALRIKGNERAEFRHLLYEMERQGKISCLRKNRWALPEKAHEVIGVLRMHNRGFGFVIPDTPGLEDIYIPEENMNVALEGDRVLVRVVKAPEGQRKGSEELAPRKNGIIVRILERRLLNVVGLLKKTSYYWYVIPDLPGLLKTIQVNVPTPKNMPLLEDHKVVIHLDEWTSPSRPLTGDLVEDLGPIDADGTDVLSVMRQHGLTSEFPPDVHRAAARHGKELEDRFLDDRKDLRERMLFTIDPDDAKDFDDAVSLMETAEGNWSLGVHIADVAHYVKPGSEVDAEARYRGTSVYMVDRVVTMLPPYLTTEVCSLQPDRDRLAHSVEMVLDPDGKFISFETFPSVIRSKMRLNYDQVQAFFDGADAQISMLPEVAATLTRMRGLAKILRRRRMAMGSLDFNLPEIRCRLDSRGHPTSFVKRTASEAYQLIEEFMLMANQAVASIFSQREIPAIYRIHEPPNDEQWERMGVELKALGVEARPSSRDEMNKVARDAAGTPLEYAVNLALLRNLKRACYSSTLKDHFGLAMTTYTHFTSPIRRYPDLLVHRLLKAVELNKASPYTHEELAAMAVHSSQMEEAADEAEEESVAIKRLVFYQDRLLAGESGPYDGLIISVAPKGLIVELSETLQRGMIPFASLHDDYYVSSEDRTNAVGRKHRTRWGIGQKVKVFLSRVDRARRLVDFYLDPEQTVAAPVRKGKPGKRAQRKR